MVNRRGSCLAAWIRHPIHRALRVPIIGLLDWRAASQSDPGSYRRAPGVTTPRRYDTGELIHFEVSQG